MTYCGESIAVKFDADRARAVTLYCRSWTCPECSAKRHKQLVAEAIGGAPRIFITLTSRRRANLTAAQAARELAHAWRLTRLRIMRRYRWRKLPFIAVFEATKAGWPHLHILARCGYIDVRWLSEQMAELAHSPVVHIERLSSTYKAAQYCAKYCGKDTGKFGTCKRYWQSQDYDIRPARKEPDAFSPYARWEREKITLSSWCFYKERAGWHVERTAHHRADARKPES